MNVPTRPKDDRLRVSVAIYPRATPVALRALIRAVSRATLAHALQTGPMKLDVHLVDDAAIHAINAEHRQVDAPTDVLSFPQLEDSGFVTPPGAPRHVGDIVLSLERVSSQADEYGHSFERELGYLTAHGILHCLGYDHETEEERSAMREREEAVMAAVGLPRPC